MHLSRRNLRIFQHALQANHVYSSSSVPSAALLRLQIHVRDRRRRGHRRRRCYRIQFDRVPPRLLLLATIRILPDYLRGAESGRLGEELVLLCGGDDDFGALAAVFSALVVFEAVVVARPSAVWVVVRHFEPRPPLLQRQRVDAHAPLIWAQLGHFAVQFRDPVDHADGEEDCVGALAGQVE